MTPELSTDRLLLRRWRDADRTPFAALNADRVVMEHFPSPLTRAESDALADRIEAAMADRPFGLWAVEVPDEAPFIGFVGLSVPNFEAAFTPCVEIGWRLARPFWGRGYATEAARRALAYGFEELELAEIVSLTAVQNVRSQRVMQRLGMVQDGEFDHPKIPGHRLERHVLYRIRA